MNIKEQSATEHLTLTLTGDLTSAHVSEMQSYLKEALTRADMLRIDIRSVTSMDLSILLLLCSAYQNAAHSRKRFELLIKDMEPFRQIVEVAGFIHQWSGDEHLKTNCARPETGPASPTARSVVKNSCKPSDM